MLYLAKFSSTFLALPMLSFGSGAGQSILEGVGDFVTNVCSLSLICCFSFRPNVVLGVEILNEKFYISQSFSKSKLFPLRDY